MKAECYHGKDVDTCPLAHRYPGHTFPAKGAWLRRVLGRLRLKIRAAVKA